MELNLLFPPIVFFLDNDQSNYLIYLLYNCFGCVFVINSSKLFFKKSTQKDFEIKLNSKLLDSEQSKKEQHHNEISSSCGM